MIDPYYSDDSVTIYHGDARDVMAGLARYDPVFFAFVILTDPPYGIGATTRNASAGRGILATAHDWPAVHGDDQPFDPSWLLALDWPTVLFGANHYASRLPDSPSWIVWDKRAPGVSNDSADCEMAWSNLGGPARVVRHEWMGMLRASERGQSYHPTQKPVAVMRWVLERMPPGVVLDPYMGGGSTLVAAKAAGRRAIGIEIEERYCEIAANRCRQEVLGLTG